MEPLDRLDKKGIKVDFGRFVRTRAKNQRIASNVLPGHNAGPFRICGAPAHEIVDPD